MITRINDNLSIECLNGNWWLLVEQKEYVADYKAHNNTRAGQPMEVNRIALTAKERDHLALVLSMTREGDIPVLPQQ